MDASAIAFAKAIVRYNRRIGETVFGGIAGDRWLFRLVAAAVIEAAAEGRTITAASIALDAEAVGISGRTATRLCKTMIDEGLLAAGAHLGTSVPLSPTPRLEALWALQTKIWDEEYARAKA